MDITKFKAQFGGGVRSNQFRVSMFFPTGITGASISGQKSEFFISAASQPPSILEKLAIPYAGRILPLPGNRTYPDWRVTIYNHQDYALRDAFESWSNVMSTAKGNVGATIPQSYFARAEVYQFDRDDSLLKTYFLENIWPLEVGPIELTWAGAGDVETFDVTFAILYWTDDHGSTLG